MNKKILTAILSALLLCSCADKPQEQSAESFSETSAVAQENNFFNNDIVYEEVWLPVKQVEYIYTGEIYRTDIYKYDEAGNEIYHDTKYRYNNGPNITYQYEYDYNSNGTYNNIFTYRDGKLINEYYYDENGRCIMEIDPTDYWFNKTYPPHQFEYKYDTEGRLIKKINIYAGERIVEYIYDEKGRLYEQHGDGHDNEKCTFRCEYGDNTVDVYYSDIEEFSYPPYVWYTTDRFYKRYEFDEFGREIKVITDYNTLGFNIYNEYYDYGTILTEYEYDSVGRLINTEDHTYNMETGQKGKLIYKEALEYDGDLLKKKIHYERSRTRHLYASEEDFTLTTEYYYDDSGRLIKEENLKESIDYLHDSNSVYTTTTYTNYEYDGFNRMKTYTYNSGDDITEETEYALIKKVKLDIEYLDFDEVKPQM